MAFAMVMFAGIAVAQSQLLEGFRPTPTQIHDLSVAKRDTALVGQIARAASVVLHEQQSLSKTRCSSPSELILWINGPTKPKVFANQVFFHLRQLGFKIKVVKEVEWEVSISRVFKMDTSLGMLYGLVVSYSQPIKILGISDRFSYLAWCIAR